MLDKNSSLSSYRKPVSRTRRRVLARGVTAGATVSLLPSHWIRPVVESVMLPVHAQTSPSEDPSLDIDGDFFGSGVSGTVLAESTPVLDLLIPYAYAGGIDPVNHPISLCISVNDNNVTVVAVVFTQDEGASLTGTELPVSIPGNVTLDVSDSTMLASGSVQFDGQGNNGLAGAVVLTDTDDSTASYPFDLSPGGCLGP